MLSAINSVFDPLGLVSPVMITGKILYSIACMKKLLWDDAVPEEIKKTLEQVGKVDEELKVRDHSKKSRPR